MCGKSQAQTKDVDALLLLARHAGGPRGGPEEFSILKFIKNRLRSTLLSDKLEAFVLMATEKVILRALDSDSVIDRPAEKTELLQKLLH